MKQVSKRYRVKDDSAVMRGMCGAGYWRFGWKAYLRAGFSLSVLISSIFVYIWNEGVAPTFVLLEATELFALFLFILNETQVEPVLFIELLLISEADI